MVTNVTTLATKRRQRRPVSIDRGLRFKLRGMRNDRREEERNGREEEKKRGTEERRRETEDRWREMEESNGGEQWRMKRRCGEEMCQF